MKAFVGSALTARGPVPPEALGNMLMHEHLHSDIYDWHKDELITQERPATPERWKFLVDDAVPLLREARLKYGMGAYCDVTMPPWRCWPDLYVEVSRLSGVAIVIATGFYRELELGAYWAKTPDRQIWPFVRESPVELLAEMCVREIAEGIHGTGVRAGCIKLGSSQAPLTPTEMKAFRAGARAQKATGVHITTHCTRGGAETSQLTLLDSEGVDLRRVVVGHTASHLANPERRKTCLEWMARGANFLPTNLGIGQDDGERWRPLVEAIHAVFDAGHGDKLCLGLDSGYCSESGPFGRITFLPPAPWTHMFTHTLPAFRRMGLTAEEEDWMMRRNPQRIVPVQ
jgi:phosphotriesterase-related protein